MRLEGNRLTISERNARALIAKLEGYPEQSACTIATPDYGFFLAIEPDDVHYAERPPGRMVDATERRLSQADV